MFTSASKELLFEWHIVVDIAESSTEYEELTGKTVCLGVAELTLYVNETYV
jgi:hypothetical protein